MIKRSVLLWISTLPLLSAVASQDIEIECYTQTNGADYRGTVSTTKTGKTCQKWSSNTPYTHGYTPEEYSDYGIGDHNHCRNPSDDNGVWCYTTDSDVRWETCDIGKPQTTCIGREQTTTSSPSKRTTPVVTALKEVTHSTTTGVITSSTGENMTTPLTTADPTTTNTPGTETTASLTTLNMTSPTAATNDVTILAPEDGTMSSSATSNSKLSGPTTTNTPGKKTTTYLTTLNVTLPTAATDDVTISAPENGTMFSDATSNSKISGPVMVFITGGLIVLMSLELRNGYGPVIIGK